MNKEIRLTDNFYLTSDKYQFILIEKVHGRNRKTGLPVVNDNKTYHSTLKQVARVIINHNIKKAEELNDIVKKIDEAVESIANTIEEVV